MYHDESYVPRLGLDPNSLMGEGSLQSSYSPIIVADWSTADSLAVVMSQNGYDWKEVCVTAEAIPYYWPSVLQIDLPD